MNSKPGESDLILHLHELLAYLNQKGVVIILILTLQGMFGSIHAEVDVSYLSDTVVLMRYFELNAEIRQVISVLKQRIDMHERTLRELTVGRHVIEVGPPLVGYRGVMTGVSKILNPASK